MSWTRLLRSSLSSFVRSGLTKTDLNLCTSEFLNRRTWPSIKLAVDALLTLTFIGLLELSDDFFTTLQILRISGRTLISSNTSLTQFLKLSFSRSCTPKIITLLRLSSSWATDLITSLASVRGDFQKIIIIDYQMLHRSWHYNRLSKTVFRINTWS